MTYGAISLGGLYGDAVLTCIDYTTSGFTMSWTNYWVVWRGTEGNSGL